MSVVPGSNPTEASQTTRNPSSQIPLGIGEDQSTAALSWQRQLSAAIRSPAELLAILDLPPDTDTLFGIADHATTQPFSLLVPQSFIDRMQPGNRRDPLLLQVLPTHAERRQAAGFGSDPVDDKVARKQPGLLQKYHGRTLLITTGACAIHCRYCFRREYPYQDEPRRLEDWQPALNEIASDDSITEVILSGGDPLMLNDDRLRELCKMIEAIPHVERIRLHTRLPIVLPARITDELVRLLNSLRCQVIIVVHANHGNEIAGDCKEVLQSIVQSGIPVLNQAVLLREINDNADALEVLCRRLINVGVMPYYLHQLDRVHGASHFESDRASGIELINELSRRLPGYAVPKFVEEIPGEDSKSPIRGRC